MTICHHRECGFIVNITNIELEEIAKKTKYCPICHTTLQYYNTATDKRSGGVTNTASWDRINNEQDMDKSNTKIICKQCNTLKSNKTLNECNIWCKKFMKYYKEVKKNEKKNRK